MKKISKAVSLLLVLTFVVTMTFTGCGNKDSDTKTTTKPADTTTKTEATTTKPAEKTKITMFMGNSGLAHPDGVDPSNNEFINIVENYANVDLELEVPGYQDFKNKLELLLSSGNLPDIVHSWQPPSMYKFADQGAFIDLKSYYDKSEPIKKYIKSAMMEASKSPSGHYFRIPMANDKGAEGSGIQARWDLVKKYNNNKWPTSVDEWVTLFRALHKADPSAIVLTNRVRGTQGITFAGATIYFWYGAVPFGSRYDYKTGKVVNNFVLPEYRAATELMRQMYKEGILDKEFATNDDAKYMDKIVNKNCIASYTQMNQCYPNINTKQGVDNPATKEYEYVVAPELTTYPKELADPIYAQSFSTPGITTHGIYISSKCKTPDIAWKVIEGFACDELYEAIFWGKENQEYTVKNGERIPDSAKLSDKKRSWSKHLALVFGFNGAMDLTRKVTEIGCGKEYSDMVWKSVDTVDAQARKNGVAPLTFTAPSEEAKKKTAESENFITQATVEAIVGKITMAQFDERVKQYQEKYGFMAQEDEKYIAEHKAEIVSKGVILDR